MNVRSLILAAILSIGCSAPEQGDDGPESGDPDAIVEELAAAQCAKLFECCSTDELGDVFGTIEVEDEAGCREALQSQADAFLLPALERSIESESALVREAEIDACVRALADRSCSGFEPAARVALFDVDGCGQIVEPRLSLSAFCTEDYECETGFCSRPPAESEGACKNPPANGDPCLNDRCDEGLYCTGDDICAEKLGAGDVCTRNADCESDSCVPGDEGDFVCAEAPDICTG
jgi:hypothetical protein